MTRFVCNMAVADRGFGIGVGHQDLTISGEYGRQSLFGIGSVIVLNSADEDE